MLTDHANPLKPQISGSLHGLQAPDNNQLIQIVGIFPYRIGSLDITGHGENLFVVSPGRASN
jgi:hypothetical protein